MGRAKYRNKATHLLVGIKFLNIVSSSPKQDAAWERHKSTLT
jgi:hypothetical protein